VLPVALPNLFNCFSIWLGLAECLVFGFVPGLTFAFGAGAFGAGETIFLALGDGTIVCLALGVEFLVLGAVFAERTVFGRSVTVEFLVFGAILAGRLVFGKVVAERLVLGTVVERLIFGAVVVERLIFGTVVERFVPGTVSVERFVCGTTVVERLVRGTTVVECLLPVLVERLTLGADLGPLTPGAVSVRGVMLLWSENKPSLFKLERVLPSLKFLFIFLLIFSPVRLPWLFSGTFRAQPVPVTVSIPTVAAANTTLLRFTNAPPQLSNPPEKRH